MRPNTPKEGTKKKKKKKKENGRKKVKSKRCLRKNTSVWQGKTKGLGVRQCYVSWAAVGGRGRGGEGWGSCWS